MRTLLITSITQLVAMLALTGFAAGQQVPSPRPELFGKTGVVTGRVHAKVGDQLLSNAKLRLRDMKLGRIVGETHTNGLGDFTFEGIERGYYVPELITNTGQAFAAGEAFALEAGQTLSLSLTISSAAGVLTAGETAGSVATATAGSSVATATSIGATAVSAVASTTTLVLEKVGEPVSGEK